MSSTIQRYRAFTIVEMIVVVGIIGLLVALVLPALSGVRKQGQKVKELNSLRQIGVSWALYSNSSNDRILPGYVDIDVQNSWGVTYQLPDNQLVTQENAASYPWRLAPFLDDVSFLVDYLDEDITATDVSDFQQQIAQEPAFGYNAYYIGGWWEMTDCITPAAPRPRFFAATDEDEPDEPVHVVVQTIAQIPRTSDQVIFASSTLRTAGTLRGIRAGEPGTHYVVPPFLADVAQWTTDASGMLIEIVGPDPVAVPAGRHTENAAVLYADNHVAGTHPNSLVDMRTWIGAADEYNFRHATECD